MASITVREHESKEMVRRRFKRACEKDGIISEIRKREFFVKASEQRKKDAAAARKRHLKMLSKTKPRRRSKGRVDILVAD